MVYNAVRSSGQFPIRVGQLQKNIKENGVSRQRGWLATP